MLILDLDHFKGINDTYGHLSGDRVLRTTGQLIGSVVRNTDLACRYGGEEFAILMPRTGDGLSPFPHHDVSVLIGL